MIRYRKYTDNYTAMLDALKIPYDIPQTSEEERKTLYTNQIDKDKPRAVVVELRPGHNALDSENIIYDHAHYQKNPYYSQGDYEARPYYIIYVNNPNFSAQLNNAWQQDDLSYQLELGFPYINDDGVPCALGITRLGHEPDAQYTIALIRNTVDAYDKREVQFICTEKIAQDEFYTSLRESHNETLLDAKEMVQAVTEQIGSAEISQLFSTILDKNGNISEPKLAKLKTRLGHYNLDDRDLLIHQLPVIMKNAKALGNKIFKKINSYYDKNTLNFFEHDRYAKLLKILIRVAKKQKPPNISVISAFQDLYLEFITIDFYYHKNEGTKHVKTGLLETNVTALKSEYAEALKTPEIDPVAFAKKINQCHRSVHYNKLTVGLEQAIRICDPSIKSIAIKELPWIQKCRLTKYSPSQQNTIIEFVNALILFTTTPDSLKSRELEKLYPRVRRDPSGLAPTTSRLEAENFAKQLAELEKKIANCQHPYIKIEAEKKLRYFKHMRFEDESSTRQAGINDLLTTLNQFIDFNGQDTLTKLAALYDQLDLIPIEQEKAETLLLPLNITPMRQQIDNNQYIFDPQGRALVTTFGSNQNPGVITWNLDITDAPNTDMEKQFDQSLLTELEKQISSSNAPKIIALFNRNKTAIYPLQQVLQMYLSQIAQVYQNTMQAKGVTPQMMQTALMETNKKMNAVVIEHLASGLVSACVSKGNLLKNLNIETLNKRLAAVQDNLRQDGKKIFSKHLRKQIQQQKQTPDALSQTIINNQKISNKTLYFDTKQSLATEISTLQSDSEDTYLQIKTYRCQGTSFTLSNVIPRSIIHSTALNISTCMPTEKFQEKLTQLSKTCRYNKALTLTYYVYAADDLQIQQTLNATHAYNRNIGSQETQPPLCFVQAPDMSESNKKLGYPLLDWSGTTSDLTLMHEMSLCSQIAAVDHKQTFNLKDYFDFLNPPTSFLGAFTPRSKVFAFSTEGRQMRNQIQTLKTSWQQDKNLNLNLNNQKLTTKTLQKMMAFDLHYDPKYALLIQAMSLTISQQTLLNGASCGQILANTLSHAQIFDILPLPDEIQTRFDMLLTATDKQTAIQAADHLLNEITNYCSQHPNTIAVAAMLPLMARETQMVQNETTAHEISQVRSYLMSAPEVSSERHKTHRIIEKEHVSTRRLPQTPNISRSTSNLRVRLFVEKNKGDSSSNSDDSLLNNAGKRTAHAFKK